MSLIDLWRDSRQQLEDKQVQQIIVFAGAGRLKDGSNAALEFREFLSHVPSSLLERYIDECIKSSFPDSGLALQDVVNEVGSRLGLSIRSGRYRGVAGKVGFDGLWTLPDGHGIIVEVKTTDAYRMDLKILAGYRRALVESGELNEERSSILLVVGRQDTGDLEAQIRGSRVGWAMRLISADALVRLLRLKETVDDPAIVQQIHRILVPQEFTRLDAIVDLVFSAAEEAKQDEEPEGNDEEVTSPARRFVPVDFHNACIARIEEKLGLTLVKRTRANFSSPDETVAVICAVSKEHSGASGRSAYWFAFHPHQKDRLQTAKHSYVAFGCGSADKLLLIPFQTFEPWLEGLWTTQREDRMYWHVRVNADGEELKLNRKKGSEDISLTSFLITAGDVV